MPTPTICILPPRVFDDYGMIGRGCAISKVITEDEYAGQVVPPTPVEAQLPGRDYSDE
jgi:hypothetical protein